ncbi:M48 family metallopeptidase [Desulfonema magnum]|uniref:M48 family metallopeptidase n=1 Tax=Desulfonema magnum TaxID=45655 RepID=UPI001A9B5F79|nr:M48 family metallopeptidase [Desulfonema magnum]
MITAAVMGLVKKFRYILVTEGLLRLLNTEEIEAVIAHEIGHVKRKHLVFYLFFFTGYMLLSYATFDLIIYFIIYSKPVFVFISRSGLNEAMVISAAFNLVVILMFIVYFRYVFGYFMRNFERQADAYVYVLFESAAPLISTFEKITLTSGQSPDKPNWHHFSITERVEYLKKCEDDKTWITRHDQKIKKSIAIYLVGMILTGGLGYHLNFGETGKKLNNHFFETAIQREIQINPNKSNLYRILGNINYRNKNYEETITAYEKAISLKPDDPHVLNNLAWLYATCEDKKFRDPEKALMLAQKAAELMEAPHILDTLAESYYMNGLFEKAVSTETRALRLIKKDRSHYETQLEKFTKAAKENKNASPPIEYKPFSPAQGR